MKEGCRCCCRFYRRGRLGGDLGQAIGTGTGYAAGTYAGTSGELPPVVVLAASPSKLYVMTSNNAKGVIFAKHLVLLDTIDRENISVEMHQKVSVRNVEIRDDFSGHEYKLEGKRVLFHQMNDMLDALAADIAEDQEHEAAVLITD